MRNYEVVLIVHPDLDDTALQGAVERVQGWITGSGGSVDKVEQWGKRRLSYAIRKQREGQYVFIETQMAPSFTAELERNMRLLEPILRYSVIVKE